MESGIPTVRNEFAGEAGVVVQAGDIAVGVHVRPDRPLPVPRQLPTDITRFTGRADDLAGLDAALRQRAPKAVVISAIAGTPGVGKTALAVHWAHRVRRRFPDGQLHINLRGYEPNARPVTAEEALGRFLRALDVPAEKIPVGLDARAVLYRSLLAGKRMIILLDNARFSSQVRPLLPGSASNLVIVTSRGRLSGLIARDGAHSLSLEPLLPGEAEALLHNIIGAERCDREPEAVTRLAHLCAHLPLALRIAAERAVARPHRRLADLAGELAGEHDRLDILSTDEDATALRAVFSWSYEALGVQAARMFRMLGLHAGPDLCVAAAAELAAVTTDVARRLLEQLAEAHLVEESAPERYRFHDLLRLYATERAATENSAPDNLAARHRVLVWYLHTADTADATLIPQRLRIPLSEDERLSTPPVFAGYREALDWLETERINLVAAVGQAVEHRFDNVACKLPLALWAFFYLRKHWDDHIATHNASFVAARRTNNRHCEAWLLGSVSLAHCDRHEFDVAVDQAFRALALCEELGDEWGRGTANNILGDIRFLMGEPGDSLRHYETALPIFRGFGDAWGEATSLTGMGNAYGALEQYDRAVACLDESLTIRRRIGDRWGQGYALHRHGDLYRAMRRYTEAIDHYREGLEVRGEIGDLHGQAMILFGLGMTLSDRGDAGGAREFLVRAEAILAELGDPFAAEVGALLSG